MTKGRSAISIPVYIVADWDADGATSAAMLYYSQYHRGTYPLKGRNEVALKPASPRTFNEAVQDFIVSFGCPSVLAVLDIPLTPGIQRSVESILKSCSSLRLVYVDHHFTTLHKVKVLEKLTDEYIVGYSPTTVLVYNMLKSLGIRRLTPRLEAFMSAVGVLEKAPSAKKVEGLENLVKLAASISKATTYIKDEELWKRLVKWLANPYPETLPIDLDLVERVLKLAAKTDKEVEEVARELAFASKRIGYFKFIDARRAWKRRGASALASKLYRILRQPVVVLVEQENGTNLLIIRARRRGAYKVALGLLKSGLAEEVGGHGSLAVVRLRAPINLKRLEETLRRLSLKL
ncbi:MAG: phosphoesterase [Thermoproteota archaeon]